MTPSGFFFSEVRNTSLNLMIFNCGAFVLKVLPLENSQYCVSGPRLNFLSLFFHELIPETMRPKYQCLGFTINPSFYS